MRPKLRLLFVVRVRVSFLPESLAAICDMELKAAWLEEGLRVDRSRARVSVFLALFIYPLNTTLPSWWRSPLVACADKDAIPFIGVHDNNDLGRL